MKKTGEGMFVLFIFFMFCFLCAFGHPCERQCDDGSEPLKCHYKFTLHASVIDCDHCQRNATCGGGSCEFSRKLALTINKKSPGPTIKVCKGDQIVVDVVNRLPGSFETSIHWHGVLQTGTPYYDGVPKVTQCPLTPGSSFRYSFSAENPGTHFYYASSVSQHADGIYGALIVNEPQKYKHEELLLIGTRNYALLSGAYGAVQGALVGLNRPIAKIVLNGKAVHEKLDEFDVTEGETVFRVINAAAFDCPVEMTLENHVFKVLNVQGADILPIYVKKLTIYPGERYDMQIFLSGEPCKYCQMQISGLHKCGQLEKLKTIVRPAETREIINKKPFKTLSANCTEDSNNYCSAQLESPDSPNFEFIPDLTFFLSFGLNKVSQVSVDDVEFRFVLNDIEYYPTFLDSGDEDPTLAPQINTVSFRPPSTPILTQYEDRNEATECETYANLVPSAANRPPTTCKSAPYFCECAHFIRAGVNATVKLVFKHDGISNEAVAFHMHGHKLYVANWQQAGREGKSNQRPICRDTIVVPPAGEVTAFFKADNPGFWLLESRAGHITSAGVGMALIVQVGTPKDIPSPPTGFPTCRGLKPDDFIF
ncbi:uncharacterized protein LOC132198021 [Neocloeon triangulifer]|uniref:uncharacterized protein LOC132198021 n=1 Tax=Neocloeon triangulifer TaxID=2078957 RepID=UPI00286EC1F9|nr:uncharacterized protein LOC132198021 [Neocloeon triangulifer]